MDKLPENIDYEITKLWFAQLDLRNTSPEEAKRIFFNGFEHLFLLS